MSDFIKKSALEENIYPYLILIPLISLLAKNESVSTIVVFSSSKRRVIILFVVLTKLVFKYKKIEGLQKIPDFIGPVIIKVLYRISKKISSIYSSSIRTEVFQN